LTQSLADPCVYNRISENEMTIMIIWVDDIIVASNCISKLKKVKECLCKRFSMKDLGEISWHIGIQFVCENSEIRMNHSVFGKDT
jgi:hypothetical protein